MCCHDITALASRAHLEFHLGWKWRQYLIKCGHFATKWSNKCDYFGLMSKWRVHVTTRQIKLTLIASLKQPHIWKVKGKRSCGRLQCVCITLRRADVSPTWESLTGMSCCTQEWCINPSRVYTHIWRDKCKNSFLGWLYFFFMSSDQTPSDIAGCECSLRLHNEHRSLSCKINT